MEVNSIILILLVVLTIYAVIILFKKLNSGNFKSESGYNWKYLIEPYQGIFATLRNPFNSTPGNPIGQPIRITPQDQGDWFNKMGRQFENTSSDFVDMSDPKNMAPWFNNTNEWLQRFQPPVEKYRYGSCDCCGKPACKCSCSK